MGRERREDKEGKRRVGEDRDGNGWKGIKRKRVVCTGGAWGIIRKGCVREIEGEGWKGGERMTVGR